MSNPTVVGKRSMMSEVPTLETTVPEDEGRTAAIYMAREDKEAKVLVTRRTDGIHSHGEGGRRGSEWETEGLRGGG